MAGFLPAADGLFATFAANFAALITAAPATYGMTAPNAATLQGLCDDYIAAYALATADATRTSVTIADKNATKQAATVAIRDAAASIKANSAVTDGNKIALGLWLDLDGPTPVAAPVTFPLLALPGGGPRTHTIRYADSLTPDKRSKPVGVIGLQLFCHVGIAAPADPLDSRFQRFVTKQPYQMQFDQADVGKTAFYFGRWQTRTGLTGPWSQVASLTIAG